LRTIATRAYPAGGLTALASRMHLDAATQTRLEHLRVRSVDHVGSSLKFCLIAEGAADVYPRHAPTMEWDTAAGQAVLVAAGGTVIDLDGEPLRYGKPGFRNPGFEAWGGTPLRP
jgi:3'(2'), 5'-bisphosphate nucleotidase